MILIIFAAYFIGFTTAATYMFIALIFNGEMVSTKEHIKNTVYILIGAIITISINFLISIRR